MHDGPMELLKQAILISIRHVRPHVGKFSTQHLVWRNLDGSQWRGEFQTRPNMVKVLDAADEQIEQASAEFCDSFASHHPDYAGMVGFRGTSHNWAKNHSHIVRSALTSLWRQHKTFELTDEQVDAIVQEFADFVDNPTVRLRFQAQLLNFKMPADSLAFPSGLSLRRLSEDGRPDSMAVPSKHLASSLPRRPAYMSSSLRASWMSKRFWANTALKVI